MKLFAFMRDPLAYLTIIVLMALFIIFTVGTYLPEYDSSDFEVALNARKAMEGLGSCFITFFLLSNLQAAIIFTIIILMVISTVFCILCVVVGCLHSENSR